MEKPRFSGEVKDLGWSKAQVINWISRSLHERESNPNPTLNDLLEQERETVQKQEQSGDPNLSTHKYVLGVLASFPEEDKKKSVADIMRELGEEYQWGE